ncbi:MAG TPA: penicillin-insensitive murein endopeptidase [Kofleriaceae bacterium]|nr:penicillin-insensitive murein endopeptidase [Kofleriaceae bacterium]
MSTADARTHKPKRRVAHAKHVVIHGPIHGQSVGAPWHGELREAARLPDGDGYHIRRPWRAFGTRSTVDYVLRVITDFREQFPDAHVLAIGDLSAEHGGPITEHRSHQSGRDADIGLVYKHRPPGYPASFIPATEDNLDCAAELALIEGFAATEHEDGGVQIMFLDFKVQGILYRWAREHDVDTATLDHLFQYPHGRGTSEGLVRHEPNHDNHLHVRFKCPHGDSACA